MEEGIMLTQRCITILLVSVFTFLFSTVTKAEKPCDSAIPEGGPIRIVHIKDILHLCFHYSVVA